MEECCKNRLNYGMIVNSQEYNAGGHIIIYKTKCKICGKIEKWNCVNLKTNDWVRVGVKIL